jgi:hypothetical protein
MVDLINFPKTVPEPRGCGDREPGGVYAECGLSEHGAPLDFFAFCPPLPIPGGIDLVNKPRLWLRTDPGSNQPVLDPLTNEPIYDLLIHIGAEHYPEPPDYYEETKRLGASRKLNPNLDLSLLTSSSRMLLTHPRAIITEWRELTLPQVCKKHRVGHDLDFFAQLGVVDAEAARKDERRQGPCLFKQWDLLLQDEAIQVFNQGEGQRPLCLRRTGSTVYQYRPSGEKAELRQEGFILGLPITGFALIKHADGAVNEKAKQKLLTGLEKNGGSALPFYETEK